MDRRCIEPQVGFAKAFRHGLALVEVPGPGRRKHVDRQGRIVWDGRMVPIGNDEILVPEDAEDWPEWPAAGPDDDRLAPS